MSLQPRLIAIQGVGFTPIALAIQGLIEQIQEEQRQQVYGSGRKLAGPGQDPLRDGPAIVKQESEEDLIRIVRDKWDAIEAAQARVVKDSFTTAKPSVLITEEPSKPVIQSVPHMGPPAPFVPMVDNTQAIAEAARLAQRKRNDEALVMILAAL